MTIPFVILPQLQLIYIIPKHRLTTVNIVPKITNISISTFHRFRKNNFQCKNREAMINIASFSITDLQEYLQRQP